MPVVQQPNILGEPQLQMRYQSHTPLLPNPIQPIVETANPAIQFEHLPFFKILKTLIKSSHLKAISVKFFGIYNVSGNDLSSILKS